MQHDSLAITSPDYAPPKLGDKILGVNVKRLREAALITPKQLAYFCKLPLKLITSIENGLVSPHLKTIKKIAAYFKVDYLSLYTIGMDLVEAPPPAPIAPSAAPPIAPSPLHKYTDPKKITKFMTDLGFTSYQLQKISNMGHSTFDRLKKVPVRIFGNTLEKLCSLFSCQEEDLLLPESENPEGKKPMRKIFRQKKIGKRLLQMRIQKGWTIIECAAQTGVSRPQISRIERNAQYPRPDTIEKLATGFDMSVKEFLAWTPESGDLPAVPKQAVQRATAPVQRATAPINADMSIPEFVELVQKIGNLSQVNRTFLLEMVEKLST